MYVETYGCQMNVSDTEIVLSVLASAGYRTAPDPESADVILANTCAVREGAEQKVTRARAHASTSCSADVWTAIVRVSAPTLAWTGVAAAGLLPQVEGEARQATADSHWRAW